VAAALYVGRLAHPLLLSAAHHAHAFAVSNIDVESPRRDSGPLR
jgi:hypothetical protein